MKELQVTVSTEKESSRKLGQKSYEESQNMDHMGHCSVRTSNFLLSMMENYWRQQCPMSSFVDLKLPVGFWMKNSSEKNTNQSKRKARRLMGWCNENDSCLDQYVSSEVGEKWPKIPCPLYIYLDTWKTTFQNSRLNSSIRTARNFVQLPLIDQHLPPQMSQLFLYYSITALSSFSCNYLLMYLSPTSH